MNLTDYQSKYFAHELTRRFPPDSVEKVTVAFAGAQVDLNPHQIDAALVFGKGSVHVAMHEFLLWPEEEDEISKEMLDRAAPLFWPWYVFNWEHDKIDAEVDLAGPEGRTVAELYSEKHGGKLNTLERRLIDGINRKPCSFLEVLGVDKGKGMTLRDILKGTHIEVQERSGSQYVQQGDVLFGRAVDVDGVGMLIGLSPTLIPPGRKAEIIQLRNTNIESACGGQASNVQNRILNEKG